MRSLHRRIVESRSTQLDVHRKLAFLQDMPLKSSVNRAGVVPLDGFYFPNDEFYFSVFKNDGILSLAKTSEQAGGGYINDERFVPIRSDIFAKRALASAVVHFRLSKPLAGIVSPQTGTELPQLIEHPFDQIQVAMGAFGLGAAIALGDEPSVQLPVAHARALSELHFAPSFNRQYRVEQGA